MGGGSARALEGHQDTRPRAVRPHERHAGEVTGHYGGSGRVCSGRRARSGHRAGSYRTDPCAGPRPDDRGSPTLQDADAPPSHHGRRTQARCIGEAKASCKVARAGRRGTGPRDDQDPRAVGQAKRRRGGPQSDPAQEQVSSGSVGPAHAGGGAGPEAPRTTPEGPIRPAHAGRGAGPEAPRKTPEGPTCPAHAGRGAGPEVQECIPQSSTGP